MISYIILDINKATTELVRICQTDSLDTARKSVDGSKVVLKFDNKQGVPDGLSGIMLYNHTEILTVLNSEEWNKEGI